VSAPYLEATITAAAVARELGGLEVFVNISQLTVSQMSLLAMTDSLQQRMHWLGEQALNWSGLPVVHIRATVFLQHFFFSRWAAESIARDGTIRLPFGDAKTSPVDTSDVAEVIAAVLEHPEPHVGRVIELTGPRSEDMRAVAAEYSEALGRTITYVDVPMAEWRERELAAHGLPEHVAGHLKTMAQLHAENRYDRMTHDFEAIIGRAATSIREYVAKHTELFGSIKPANISP
jgi:NAD(P)H dehydrogenase (quinone)